MNNSKKEVCLENVIYFFFVIITEYSRNLLIKIYGTRIKVLTDIRNAYIIISERRGECEKVGITKVIKKEWL